MRNSAAANCSSSATDCERNCSLTISNGSDDDSRDEYLADWEVATLALMFAVAAAGNSLVVTSLYFRRCGTPRKRLPRIYFFILHLSIADLLTALLNVLPQLVWEITFRFRGGPILCKFVKYGQPLGPYLSSYVLTATALDRYQAVCRPLVYCSVTSRRSRAMLCCAWGVSLALCVPQLIVFSYQEVSPGVWDCWATFDLAYGQRAYVTWYSASVFILPLAVVVYTYASICIVIRQNAGIVGEARDTQGGLLRRRPVISRAKIHSVRQMIAVVSFYAASSSPFIASLLWATWDPNAPTTPFFSGATFTILTLMSSLNSCVNPWIYLSLNPELSRALIDRVCPSGVRSGGQSQGNHRELIEVTRCGGNASSSGASVRSSASTVSRYANSILRSPGNFSSRQPSTGAR